MVEKCLNRAFPDKKQSHFVDEIVPMIINYEKISYMEVMLNLSRRDFMDVNKLYAIEGDEASKSAQQ